MNNITMRMGRGKVLVRGLCCEGENKELNVGCLNLENTEENNSVHIEFKALSSIDSFIILLEDLKRTMQEKL